MNAELMPIYLLRRSGEGRAAVDKLTSDVVEFATSFPLPGVPDSSKIKRTAEH
jgi:hypothetical protein